MSILDLLIGTPFREHSKVVLDTLGKTEDTVVSFPLREYLNYAEDLVKLSLLEDGLDAGKERDSLFITTMTWFILKDRDDVPEKLEEVKKALKENGRYKFDADDEEEDKEDMADETIDAETHFSAQDLMEMVSEIFGIGGTDE